MINNISTNELIPTNDRIIRKALRDALEKDFKKYNLENKPPVKIFEEFRVQHGMVRIDFAVINSIMHGFEIKSDLDTLKRLPKQIKEYGTVFDKITLVVGKRHLYNTINMIPDWWGIMLVKIDVNHKVIFQTIRESEDNRNQAGISIARLLWREEALQILEEQNKAKGVRSKPRKFIYDRLADVLDLDALKEKVKYTLLVSRGDWRSAVPLMLSGDL